jgi:hypothetical protein
MTSLMDTAWTILEAANDLGDGATVEVCGPSWRDVCAIRHKCHL